MHTSQFKLGSQTETQQSGGGGVSSVAIFRDPQHGDATAGKQNTVVCPSFHPIAKEHVHALEGLAYRKRVAAASSPAATCKQVAALTSVRLHDTFAAAPGLLGHTSVTKILKFSLMGPKLRHTTVLR